MAFGAVATGGVRVLDRELIESAGISEQEIEQITDRVKAELERRERLYRGSRAPLQLDGKIAIARRLFEQLFQHLNSGDGISLIW